MHARISFIIVVAAVTIASALANSQMEVADLFVRDYNAARGLGAVTRTARAMLEASDLVARSPVAVEGLVRRQNYERMLARELRLLEARDDPNPHIVFGDSASLTPSRMLPAVACVLVLMMPVLML